jgi:hypothetical protein
MLKTTEQAGNHLGWQQINRINVGQTFSYAKENYCLLYIKNVDSTVSIISAIDAAP